MHKVLVADDSIAVRKVAERLLIEAGFGVTLVANGEEAMAYLAKETPDLIVSDVIMPDKSGYEVCAFVRAQSGLANTPVLLISGIVNDEVTKQAEVCHADGVLKKPFQGTSLKDRVTELLAKRQGAATKVAPLAAVAIEAATNASVNGEQLETYRLAAARVKPLEDELQVARDRVLQMTQYVAQLEGQVSSVKDLESMMMREREQSAMLKQKVADADRTMAMVQELESAMKKEREERAQQAARIAELQITANRVQEMESTLEAERQAALQLVQQMNEVEKSVTRVQELSQQLAKEQERSGELSRRVSELETVAARVNGLEQALAVEREKNTDLVSRLSVSDAAAQAPQELETLLQTERERNSILARRVSDAEQATEQATKRFEDMAKKLGEIAGLASQLGSGSQRS
ncbi:MAG: response regulator [Nitrospira sp.]|nr:response regulator [Nitrospira sp.]